MKRAIAGAACALALGCGSVVTDPSQSGSGGATTSTTTSTGTGGGALACVDDPTLFVDITGDVPLQHVDASCTPFGAMTWYSTDPEPPHPPKTPKGPSGYLGIIACPTASTSKVLTAGAPGTAWPTTVTGGDLAFWYEGGSYSADPSMSDAVLDITTFEPVGGVIEGSFSGTVTRSGAGDGPSSLEIEGKFRVCRFSDGYTG